MKLSSAEPETARTLLSYTLQVLHEPSLSVGLTLEVVRERLCNHPTLLQHPRGTRTQLARNADSRADRYRRKEDEHRRQRKEKQRQEREDWERYLREHATELRDNRFSPQDLNTLARVYLNLGVGADRRRSPREHISSLIGGDPRLVDAVMAAFRGAVSRCEYPRGRPDDLMVVGIETLTAGISRDRGFGTTRRRRPRALGRTPGNTETQASRSVLLR